MSSEGYLKQKVKSQREPHSDANENEVKLKVKLHGLRFQKRRAEWVARQLQTKRMSFWTVPPTARDAYQRWSSGALAQEIDLLTELHGYGKLSTGKYLVAENLNNFLPSR